VLAYLDSERLDEVALEHTERRLGAILDAAPVMLLTFDRDKIITYQGGGLGDLRAFDAGVGDVGLHGQRRAP